MSIGDYFDLMRIVLQEPLFNGRVEMLKRELLKHGYSYETGILTAELYFQEMEKAVINGKENSIFQSFKTLIVKDDYYYFCEDGAGFGAQIKIRTLSFKKFGEILNESKKAIGLDQANVFKSIEKEVSEKLFEEIKAKGYIAESTNSEVFIELFTNSKIPSASDKIVWIKNKQSLREMLKSLKVNGGTMTDIERIVDKIFLYKKSKGRPPEQMRLANDRLKETDTDSHEMISIVKKMAL